MRKVLQIGILLAGIGCGFLPRAAADTFGTTSIGGSTGTTSRIACKAHVAPANGTVSSMSWYGSGSSDLGTAIYADSGGAPAGLLASSSNTTPVTDAGWYTVNIAHAITSGTTYWLCFWSNGTLTYNFAAGANMYVSVSTSGSAFTWEDPYLSNGTSARTPSIYATYTPRLATVIRDATINNATLR